MNKVAEKSITVRAKAFTGEGVREHSVRVGADGSVRVYDLVADHYTLRHALSDRAQRRIRALALVTLTKGTPVTIRDENGERVAGTVHSYGQANDGTGRYGYNVQVGDALYWREASAVEA